MGCPDSGSKPLLVRVADPGTAPVVCRVNGRSVLAREGDTVLTALLLACDRLRSTPFSGAARAGFCVMGACQDCWVQLEDGGRVHACSTPLRAGMAFVVPEQA